MRTKFKLYYDGIEYELRPDDVRNWDEIVCAYARNDYAGLTRSVTSQIQFVNAARELLMGIYLRDGINASVDFAILVKNERWGYDEKLRCTLQFHTIEFDTHTLTLFCRDNSLAAYIKAGRGTKYEMIVGSDILPDDKFKFDRIPMADSITYGFTQGTSFEDESDLYVTFERDTLPWIGNVGTEILINGVVYWKDDQETTPGSYIFRAERDMKVTMCYSMEWRTDCGVGGVNLSVRIRRDDTVLPVIIDANDGNGGLFSHPSRGIFHPLDGIVSPSQLPDPSTVEKPDGAYALIDGKVWILQYNGHGYTWKNTGLPQKQYFLSSSSGEVSLKLKAGDEVFIEHSLIDAQAASAALRFTSSKFIFRWIEKGRDVEIDVFTPETIAKGILNRIVQGNINVDVSISGHDSRLANTYLMAAESARAIDSAKFFSSFNDFTDWMAAVFGYVLKIGEPISPQYRYVRPFGHVVGAAMEYEDASFSGSVDSMNIVYVPQHARFLYFDADSGKYYKRWQGNEQYNHPGHGHPRTDTIFRAEGNNTVTLYYFDDYTPGASLQPLIYPFGEDCINKETQTVYFIHRSELLNANVPVHKIKSCTNFEYSVERDVIYSSVTIGYEKKDYESINGRDEFNFNNTYSTGCMAEEKALSLLSKYRADSYGIEFAVQKRGKDTSDSNCDSSVFFILCKSLQDGTLAADRTAVIENALTDCSFNGAFSPIECVRANAGFIGMQASPLTLTFASSTGNSAIVIDGMPMSGDITLDTPLATAGMAKFTVDEIVDEMNLDELVEVENGGYIYRGFINRVDFKYAREESVDYYLIVKEIESC